MHHEVWWSLPQNACVLGQPLHQSASHPWLAHYQELLPVATAPSHSAPQADAVIGQLDDERDQSGSSILASSAVHSLSAVNNHTNTVAVVVTVINIKYSDHITIDISSITKVSLHCHFKTFLCSNSALCIHI